MNTRDTERELAALLHRHAEDAMNDTDTQAEREVLSDVLEAGPHTGRPSRRLLAVVGTVAAAGLVTASVWTLADGQDGTDLPAAGSTTADGEALRERDAARLADQVVQAYAAGDTGVVASMSAQGAQSWPDLRRKTDRDRAWSVVYLLKPCEAKYTYSNGVMVECFTDLHLLHSEEVGAGPFEKGATFTLLVRDGQVSNADVNYEVDVSGMGSHVDDVFTWVEDNHAQDVEFLLGDEVDVPADEWDRWTLLWQQYAAEYAAAATSSER